MMVRNTRFSIFLIALITSITLSLAKKNIEEFFEQFGYLPQSNGTDRGHDIPPEQIELAISKFQRFNGLKVTGILDEPTKRKMYQPRCGVKDIFDKGGSFRKVSKWSKTNLTWSLKQFSATSRLTHRQQLHGGRVFKEYSSTMFDCGVVITQEAHQLHINPDEDVIRRKFEYPSPITAIKNALNHWASVTPLTFTEVPHGGDIDIRFAAADHGDGYSFDGPGGVLAHAFFPSNGNTHFDDSEEWTIHSKEGIDLEIVAAHEFGHALGLAHSQVSTSLMAPYYRGYIPNFKLDPDDVRGIQSLYGVVNRRLTRPSVTKTTTIRPPWGFGYCNHRYTRIDATIRVLGRVDYVFVDHKFVISSKTGRKKPIRNVFGKGPARVEAALYSIETNKVYLAYDDKFWAYTVLATGTRFELDVGYPKKLTNNMAIHMNALMGMDMSYSHYKSVRIFILKDKYFWELIPSHNYVTRGRGYQIIKFFPNAPKRFDSILSINDVVYFLSNNMFYRMKVSERHVSSTGIPLKKVLLTCRNR